MSQNEHEDTNNTDENTNWSSSNYENESLVIALEETQHIFNRFLEEINNNNLSLPLRNESNSLEAVQEIDEELRPDNTNSSLQYPVSYLESHSALTTENKRSKLLQLPPEQMPMSPNCCEKVGDDVANRRTHIVCECDKAGVAGGAVPIVTSFTLQDSAQDKEHADCLNIKEEKIRSKPKASLIPKPTNSFKSTRSYSHSSSAYKLKIAYPEKILSSKMITFQEKLEVTSSVLKTKHNNTETIDNRLNSSDKSNEKEQQNPLLNDLYVNISKLNVEAMNLSKTKTIGSSMMAIESIEKLVSDLKYLINKMKNSDKFGKNNEDEGTGGVLRSKTKENNKIYIKFLANKAGIKKKKSFNEETQTDMAKDTSISDQVNVGEEIMRPSNQDSMDGLFIPSQEIPLRLEEEDEDGVDVTITFPELQQNIGGETDSHLSVCFSDISADALGRLKRCPKDFTLQMNFTQGRMIFQTGSLPANSFSIGTDLKITECPIDNKKSDIISIKPSTECTYASQVIPVEGEKRKSSVKVLKSTDSELFNVVSLPVINRKFSDTTKSCITFKNESVFPNEAILFDRFRYKSMPQIPSLTRIVEEPTIEFMTASKSVLGQTEKKLRYPHLQRKRTNTSLDKLDDP